jgi:hypothetical protein
MAERANRTELRDQLRIDDTDLDEELVRQPELNHQVAEAHALATARHDAIKLELEEVQVELDKKLREEAADNEAKLTETALKNALRLAPEVKRLKRELLTLSADVDWWDALRDSYKQRSRMLERIVEWKIGNRIDLGMSDRANRAAREDASGEIRQRMRRRREDGGDGR